MRIQNVESKQQLITKFLYSEEHLYLQNLLKNYSYRVASSMKYITAKKGEIIVEEGMPCNAIYIIIKGRAGGFELQTSGKVYAFNEYTFPKFFGESEILSNRKNYCNTIRAITNCELISISRTSYIEWMKQDNNALFIRAHALAEASLDGKSKNNIISFDECKDRLLIYIFESCEKNFLLDRHKLNITQEELAKRIGASSRTVVRNIKTLKEQEMLSTEGGRIVISEEQYLRMKKHINTMLLDV